MLSISLSHFMTLHNSGKVPLPRKLGKRNLWSAKELQDWINAGCPKRAEWQTEN